MKNGKPDNEYAMAHAESMMHAPQREPRSETDYLRQEASRTKAAMRRTVSELRHAGGQLLHPRQTFGRHPWLSLGVVLGLGGALGWIGYLLFRDTETHTPREYFERRRRSRTRRVLGTAIRAFTWLAGNVALLGALWNEPDAETDHQDIRRRRGAR